MIELKWVKEHTDCMSDFLVCAPINITIKEFIDEVLFNGSSTTHGTIHICSSEVDKDNHPFTEVDIEYKHAKTKDNHPFIEVNIEYNNEKIVFNKLLDYGILNKTIIYSSANGGYGIMDFYLEFNKDNKDIQYLSYIFEEPETDDQTGGHSNFIICHGSTIEEVISNYCAQRQIDYISSEVTYMENTGFCYKTSMDENAYFIPLPTSSELNPRRIIGFRYEFRYED